MESSLDLSNWKKQGAVLELEPGKKPVVRPKENIPKSAELFFDFEGDTNEPELTEGGQKYRSKSISILNSGYIVDSSQSLFGKRSAYFSGKRNQIHMSVMGNSLFGENPEAFSITIPIRTSEQGTSSVILDRGVFIKGKKYGFTLELLDNRPILYVNNLLHKTESRTASFIIESTKKIRRKEWEIISIYFEPTKNRVALYINGIEDSEFVSDSEDTIGFGFPPNDGAALVLGKSFYGHIDGFHIHRGEPLFMYPKYESVTYSNDTKRANFEGSTITSPIYETKYSNSRLTQIKLNSQKPEDTEIEVYFRGDNKKFHENSQNLSWKRISKDLKNLPLDRFKFHQWKVWLRPNPMGSHIPKLISFSYIYMEQQPPLVPSGFKLAHVQNESNLCFVWNANHEKEVKEGGGYLLHYGLLPDRMIGTIFVKETSFLQYQRIDGKNQEGNLIKHCIDELDLISNAYIPDGSLNEKDFEPVNDQKYSSRMEKNTHIFQSGHTYYFRISAYNKFLNEWDSRDQRSGLSQPVRFSFPKEISNR